MLLPILLILLSNASASLIERDCRILPKNGCLLIPQGTVQGLVIYLRGHLAPFKGQVPLANRAQSVAEALQVYQLEELALSSSMAVFVSASSHLAYDNQSIQKLWQRLVPDTTPLPIYLAAHSGGYRGLYDSLQTLTPSTDQWLIKSMIMLDNFYSTQVSDLNILKKALEAGIDCSGFFTSHNQTRFEKLYAPLGCQAQGPQGFHHVNSVKSCLLPYLKSEDCHP